ncbi:MAG: YqgE/AlgH family protein [Acidobacteriota bacterium]
MTDDELRTPIFLLAMPQVMDPFFHKSVILLVAHESEGSLGFIVNRPMELKISSIMEDLEIPWLGDPENCAFFGGPVSPELGTLVYREAHEDEHQVCPGVAVSQSVEHLTEVAAEPPESFRLLLGYAGWGDGQLEREILRNDWLIAPVQTDLIFADDPDAVWRSAVESVGIDPDQLPLWTQGGAGSSAN